jgi:hypothetical protein
MVACVPALYELLKNASPGELGGSTTNGGKRIPGWSAAEGKLRKRWLLLGFVQVPRSDVFALSLDTRRPSMETVMHKCFTGTRRKRSNTQRDS